MLKFALAVVIGLALGGCAPTGQAPGSAPVQVRLELSPRADFQELFRATLETTPSGALCRYDYDLVGDCRHHTVSLSRSGLDEVLQGLGQAGALELDDGDCGDPEPQVLYTRLEVSCGPYRKRSLWRGLSEPQARVAAALLDSPLGPQLRDGLEAVRRRK